MKVTQLIVGVLAIRGYLGDARNFAAILPGRCRENYGKNRRKYEKERKPVDGNYVKHIRFFEEDHEIERKQEAKVTKIMGKSGKSPKIKCRRINQDRKKSREIYEPAAAPYLKVVFAEINF